MLFGAHKIKWEQISKSETKEVKIRMEVKYLHEVLKATQQVILIMGCDPTPLSILHDLIDLEKRMVFAKIVHE